MPQNEPKWPKIVQNMFFFFFCFFEGFERQKKSCTEKNVQKLLKSSPKWPLWTENLEFLNNHKFSQGGPYTIGSRVKMCIFISADIFMIPKHFTNFFISPQKMRVFSSDFQPSQGKKALSDRKLQISRVPCIFTNRAVCQSKEG